VTGCDLAQIWSLVVELTFYGTLPIWFLLMERFARGRPARQWVPVELTVLAMVSVISVVLHYGIGNYGVHSVIGGTVIGFALWFALGMGLAIVSVALEGKRRPPWLRLLADWPWLPWIGALAIYVILCLYLPATPFFVNASQLLWTHLAFALIALLTDASSGLCR
jgi:peptidoglycan/LPS O-acetylase OafA/YrhL